MGQLAILRSQCLCRGWLPLAGTSSFCLLFIAGKSLPGNRTTTDSQQVIESKGPGLLGGASEGVSEGLESCPSCNQLNKYLPQKRIKARENE